LLLLYGDKYASGELSAVATLELLAVAFALTMATAAIVTLLVAEQREQRLPLVTFAGLVVNLACNVALLPANAFPAAAVATLATEACVFALGLLLLIRSPTLRLLRPAAILYLLPAAALALGFELIADDFGWQRLLAAFALCCLAVAALLQLPASRRARRQLAEHALAGARD
jgi:O-antigen/teichoic acid export membrane protein